MLAVYLHLYLAAHASTQHKQTFSGRFSFPPLLFVQEHLSIKQVYLNGNWWAIDNNLITVR